MKNIQTPQTGLFLRYTLLVWFTVVVVGFVSATVARASVMDDIHVDMHSLFTILVGTTGFVLFSCLLIFIQVLREVHIEKKQKEPIADELWGTWSHMKHTKSALLHRSAVEGVGAGIFIIGRNAEILFANNIVQKMLRWKYDGSSQHFKDVLRVTTEDGRELSPKEHPIERAIQERHRTRTDPHNTYVHHHNDGSTMPITLIATPIILEKALQGIVVLVLDSTEDKRVEQKRSEFISFANHELRAPLTAIAWYSEILAEELRGEGGEEVQGCLSQITQSTKQMKKLVDALVNICRVESGQIKIEPVRTNIIAMIQEVTEEITPRMTEKSIDFSTHLPPIIDAFVDAALVRIVLENLLSNATKYTPAGGAISLHVTESDGMCTFRIQDTGYGIPDHQKKYVFDKMFRAQNVQMKQLQGTGMGLYIAKSIVRAWKGDIWFESSLDEGTEFFFTMPITMRKVNMGYQE